MRKHVILIYILLLCSIQFMNGQSRIITGTVTTSEDNQPLPGVNVTEKGTINGTITDLSGKYSLSVTGDSPALVFSFVGMKSQEVPIGDKTVINASLQQEFLGIEEIIVTAIGIKRNSRDLSYSVQKVGGDAVENKMESDVMRALSGRIAGVFVSSSGGAAGSSSNIVIRGNSSALGNNQPLFVVDGIPYDNSTYATQNNTVYGSTYSNRALDIDPNDIESITVLKSGASAALYGSRAANGVIVITTKSGGKSGSKKFDVSFTSTYAMEEPTKLPKYQNEYGQGANFQFNSGYFGTWGPRFDAPDLDGNGDGLGGSSLLFDNNGVISYTNHLGEVVPYKAYPNNVSDFFKKGSVIENSLNISGGDANTNFVLAVNANNEDGFIPYTSLDKYSLKIAGNQKLGDKFKIGGSMTYSSVDQLGVPTGGFGVTNTNIFGQLWIMPRSYDLSGFPYEDPVTKTNIHYRSDRDNPYYIAKYNTYSSKVDRTMGFADMSYTIAPWLNASYKIGVNTYTDRRQQVYAKSTQFNDGLGSIIDDDITFNEMESNLLLTAHKTTGKIDVTAIAGWNVNQRTQDRQSFQGNEIIVAGINDLDNTKTVLPNGGIYSKRRIIGLFGDVSVGYGNWAFLNITGRNDFSSTLPVANNSYFYPSVTASAILTDAIPSLKGNVLSYLKLYGGISKIGNDADVYLTTTTYSVNPTFGNNLGNILMPFNGVAGLENGNTLGNNSLKPEFTTEHEIGTDVQFFNNRFGIDFTYYDRVSTDQIFSVQMPASSGYISKVLNAGEITNKGIEMAINAIPVSQLNGLRWNIALNFSKNNSKVVSLFEDVDQIDIGTNFTNFGSVNKVGYPYGVVQGTVFRRDDEGNLLINPATGYAMAANELGIIADPNPDFLTGLSNSFSYKGINLSFMFEFRKGGELYSNTINELRSRGVVAETAIDREAGRVIKGVLADPNNPSVPLLDVNGNKIPNNIEITTNNYFFRGFPAAEADVYDATILRFRELVVGYSLPEKWTSSLKIKDVNISLIGRNLWFYAPNVPHIDPETSGYEAGNRQGIDYYYIPNARKYAVSLRLKF
ncbi:MAG: SusC/RagA family TonB-linked outer membrane protein [Bacteroidales bacterium]|nr:SusC/RagA family TonB-linked outer membrane protein [Bacteroidales bacterium]